MGNRPIDTCQWDAKELMAQVVKADEHEKDERIAKDVANFGVDIDLETGVVTWPNWR